MRAEQVRREIEGAPLPVKIRFLAEFMASDRSNQLATLRVPLLVLRPGFNDVLLSNSAHAWYKASFHDAWNRFASSPRIKLMTIPDARALILDDQPTLTADALREFVKSVRRDH